MLLKLRRKRPARRFPRSADFSLGSWNLFRNKDLASHDTTTQGIPKLAAHVHLFSVEKYGEIAAVQKKVLIVDDSPAEIKLMQSLLEKEGYWPVGLNDPKRVEEAIAHERWYQTCALIKKNPHFATTPVVMLSSKDGLFDRARGRMVGSDEYLTKPFTRDELLRAVRRFA